MDRFLDVDIVGQGYKRMGLRNSIIAFSDRTGTFSEGMYARLSHDGVSTIQIAHPGALGASIAVGIALHD